MEVSAPERPAGGATIDVYERVILGLTGVLLVLALAAIGGSVFVGGVHLPGPVMHVDPRHLRETPPFDQPGLRAVGDGRYEAVMIAQTWSFAPAEITVPVGSTVTFRVASADVTHGFDLAGTDVNLTLVPGHVAEATARFTSPGTHLLVCHEYCGIGHHTMFARVIVQ